MPKKPSSPTIHQTAIGNDNIQVVGSHNVITHITNFITGDTEQQRAMRNRRAMLELVKNTWIKGVLEKSLYNEVLIELGMEERSGAVYHPWDTQVQMPNQVNRALPPGISLIQVFDEMNGAMLILGEPGSGKTTMLLELARDSIVRATQDDGQPIPTVFNLSSWSDKQTIEQWLVNELSTKYYVPKKTAEGWILNNDLQILLDGLDEVKLEFREACVKAINSFRQKHGLTVPIAVCSRIADYDALTKRLDLTGAVLLQPLTSQQIEEYFEQAGPKVAGVHKTLMNDKVLQELAKQPLILSILTLTYRGVQAEKLISEPLGSLDDHRKYLFNTYIQQMFERVARTKNELYTPEETKHWLVWLAKKVMDYGQPVFFIEQLQKSWLDIRQQVQHKTIIGVAFGTIGLLAGEAVWGPTGALICGIILGSVGTLVSGWGKMTLRKSGFEKPTELLRWSWWRALRGLLFGVILGLAAFLISELVGFFYLFFMLRDLPDFSFRNELRQISQNGTIEIGLTYMLLFVVVLGLIGMLLYGLNRADLETRSFPNQGIRQSLKNSLIIWLLFAIPIGVASGLAFSIFSYLLGSHNTPFIFSSATVIVFLLGFALGLPLGLVIGSGFGLYYGGYAVINHYVLRFLLYRSGHMPWNYMRFLDYCVDRIFLRRVGSGYIFVHRLLMEHFAAMYPKEEKAE